MLMATESPVNPPRQGTTRDWRRIARYPRRDAKCQNRTLAHNRLSANVSPGLSLVFWFCAIWQLHSGRLLERNQGTGGIDDF